MGGCITVCCDPEYWEDDKLNWLMQEPNVWLTIGCHPSKAPLFTKDKEAFMKRYLKHDKIVALGEIGLDESWYKRGGVTKSDQMKAFKAQIDMAVTFETKKPIVIHLRGDQSVEDAYEILRESGLSRQRRIHMHCIGATKMTVIQKWIEEWPNMMFGVTSNYFLMEVGSELPLNSSTPLGYCWRLILLTSYQKSSAKILEEDPSTQGLLDAQKDIP